MEEFTIRRAEAADALVIAEHRVRMFQDMGQVPLALFESLRAGSESWTREALESGEYVGWLASPEISNEAVAGAGVQLRLVPPHPLPTGDGNLALAEGRHAIVLNVFTEPDWRRRGLATRLMNEILDWARAEKIERLLLHASAEGRALYESLGFVPTNEMRYGTPLVTTMNEL